MGKWKAGLGDAGLSYGTHGAEGDALSRNVRDPSLHTPKGQGPEVTTTTKSIFAGNKGSGMEVADLQFLNAVLARPCWVSYNHVPKGKCSSLKRTRSWPMSALLPPLVSHKQLHPC